MVRLLLLLLSMVSPGRTSRRPVANGPYPPGGTATGFPPPERTSGRAAPDATEPQPAWIDGAGGAAPPPGGQRRRRRVPRWAVWVSLAAVAGIVFRRAVAAVVLAALSAALHLAGVNVHLPHLRITWPWQTSTAHSTVNTDLGPWVLQKIEGISRPALGRANFTFLFTHKVSRNIGPWPCWYASTFYAVGHASATVDLNPGPAWWKPAQDHYRLQVMRAPAGGNPGQVAVTMVLPQPQLPNSAHDVTIDNLPSKPVGTQHSWTYPGLGCGVVINPQFPQSVLYAQAQQIAFYKSRHSPKITGALVRTAEREATATIRDNFIQPTVNALGYKLDRLTIRWAGS